MNKASLAKPFIRKTTPTESHASVYNTITSIYALELPRDQDHNTGLLRHKWAVDSAEHCKS